MLYAVIGVALALKSDRVVRKDNLTEEVMNVCGLNQHLAHWVRLLLLNFMVISDII